MAKINFGGTEETVVTRDEFPLEKAREVLKNEVHIETSSAYDIQIIREQIKKKKTKYALI